MGAPVVAAAAAAPPPPVEILWDYENVPVSCLLGYRDTSFRKQMQTWYPRPLPGAVLALVDARESCRCFNQSLGPRTFCFNDAFYSCFLPERV